MVDGQSVKEISLGKSDCLWLYAIGEGHRRHLFPILGTMLSPLVYRARKSIYFEEYLAYFFISRISISKWIYRVFVTNCTTYTAECVFWYYAKRSLYVRSFVCYKLAINIFFCICSDINLTVMKQNNNTITPCTLNV